MEKDSANRWKIGFMIVLFTQIITVFLLVVPAGGTPDHTLPDSIAPTSSQSAKSENADNNISAEIEPYRTDIEGGVMVATFQIQNTNKNIPIDKVTYWTDKKGACKAITSDFSEFIKIPLDEINNYVFFQFSNAKDTSPIYAASQQPIFQCGELDSTAPPAGLANPASAYCQEQGGATVIVTNPDGSQAGTCTFPDGRSCDEWEFFRTKVCK